MLMIPDSRVRQRDFLLEISRAITAQLDLSEVLKRALHASVVMLTGQAGLVALRSADGLFYVRAVSGIDPDLISQMNHYLHQLVAGAEEGMDVDKFNAKLSEMAESIDEELRQSVALPLTFADEPLGLMIVFRSYVGRTSANDLQVLRSFADQAAIAVHNAQLYEKINQEHKRMTAILQHSADGVMILNSELKILHFNRALERMTGRSAEEAIGNNQEDILNWHKLEQGDLRAALEAGWPLTLTSDTSNDDPLYVEGDLLRPDGSILSIGIGTSIIGIAEMAGEFLTAAFSDRFGLKRSIFVGLTLSLISYALLPFAGQTLPLALGGLFFIFLTVEFTIVTFLSLLTELIPEARATMISCFFAFSGIGRVAGAFAGGFVWMAGGILAIGLVSAGIIAVAMVAIVWGLKHWRKD